jgi:glycosyltransferase involved in cell wall biosynthesis
MSIQDHLDSPKVTVLMSVYNGERYLREAIDSILTQTFLDFELAIVNDGSIDSTAEIISSYNDPRIRLINNARNLGLTKSLNKGLELARGQFVARQDADDISEPERLAKQVDFLEAHPDIALLGTFYQEIDERGNKIADCKLPCDCTNIRWALFFYTPFIHGSVMFRRATALAKIGFYNEHFRYAQDYDYWCRIALSLKVANLNEYLVGYRLSPSSMTSTYGKVVRDEPIEIMKYYTNSILGQECYPDLDVDKLAPYELTVLLAGSLELLVTLDLHQIDKSIRSILSLQSPFCNYYELSSIESDRHHADVWSYISDRLIGLAYYCCVRDNYLSWQLLVRAVNIRKQAIFSRTSIKLVLKLLIGSRLFGALTQIIKK